MLDYKVIVLASAAEALASIAGDVERGLVKQALGKLIDRPDDPKPYEAKERREGWELYVGRWKVTYEIRRIELVVYVHNIKERRSLKFVYRD